MGSWLNMQQYDLKEPLLPIRAFKIKTLHPIATPDKPAKSSWQLIPIGEGVDPVIVDHDFVYWYDINHGDYYIVDGYGRPSIMAAKVFEERYKSI